MDQAQLTLLYTLREKFVTLDDATENAQISYQLTKRLIKEAKAALDELSRSAGI